MLVLIVVNAIEKSHVIAEETWEPQDCCAPVKTIQTKALFNVTSGQFLGLGYGSIADSTADGVCVSAFSARRFSANTAIGAIDRLFAEGELAKAWHAGKPSPGCCTLLETEKIRPRAGAPANMRHVLIVCMGEYGALLGGSDVGTLIKQGLQSAAELLRERPGITQLDLTALGTQYGGVAKREVFDWVADWTQKLFQVAPTLNAVRFVANDIDTFIELFEAIQRLQNWRGKDLRLAGTAESSNSQILQRALREIEIVTTPETAGAYEAIKKDISSAARLLDHNPKAVLLLCRAVVEAIVHKLCDTRLASAGGSFYEDVQRLNQSKVIPTQINSFLHTCRVLGNFANHNYEDFDPTFRDAELVMLLTLRVSEWYLKSGGG
jgi:hypothetical protein